MKIKTYVLTVSKVFPKTHKRAGEKTNFPEKIINCTHPILRCACGTKTHTIRANYELWKKRIDEVNNGNAILSVRYWSGKPYNSKQVEICQLDKESGVGVQKLKMDKEFGVGIINNGCPDKSVRDWHDLAKNDGLNYDDFTDWFKKYDLSKPMAIIHFAKFRY